MKKTKKKIKGLEFDIIGEKGKGYEIAFKNTAIGYGDTLAEVDMVIEQFIGNGVGNIEPPLLED